MYPTYIFIPLKYWNFKHFLWIKISYSHICLFWTSDSIILLLHDTSLNSAKWNFPFAQLKLMFSDNYSFMNVLAFLTNCECKHFLWIKFLTHTYVSFAPEPITFDIALVLIPLNEIFLPHDRLSPLNVVSLKTFAMNKVTI